MELEHSFTVPVPRSRAWDVLLDVERVASCMPGATLDSVDGDEIHGRIKVKVGPINMTYAGKARFIEKDADAGVVTLEASGKETRGAGTASATVHSVLEDRGDETHVKVRTTLNVTGKPAQFGRGVMNEVSGKLLNIFAANLASTISEDEAGASAPASGATASAEQGASADGGAQAGGAADQPPARTANPGTGNGASADAAQGSAAVANGVASHATTERFPGSGTLSARATGAAGAETPVEELSLPVRATTSLRREGVLTAGQLAAKSEEELLAIDGVGPASLVDIKAKLGDLGMSLAGAPAAEAGGTAAAEAPPAAQARAEVSPAGQAQAGTAAPVRRGRSRGAAHQREDDSLNLLKVAGLPMLKRAAPALAALAAALVIGLARKASRRKR